MNLPLTGLKEGVAIALTAWLLHQYAPLITIAPAQAAVRFDTVSGEIRAVEPGPGLSLQLLRAVRRWKRRRTGSA